MAMLEERLKRTLNKFLSPIVAKTILTSRLTATNIDLYNLRIGDRQRLADALKKGAGRYLKPEDRKKCFLELDDILIHSGSSIPSPPMRMSSEREQKIEINNEIERVIMIFFIRTSPVLIKLLFCSHHCC